VPDKVKFGDDLYDETGNTASTPVEGDFTATRDLVGALTLKFYVGADATSNNQISVMLEVDLSTPSATWIT